MSLFIMLVVAAIALLAMYGIITYILRVIDADLKDSIYFNGQKKKKNLQWYSFYDFFSQWRPTEHYIKRLRNQYDVYYPGQEKVAAEKAIKLAFLNWGIDLIAVIVIILFHFKWLLTLVILCEVYFINSAIVRETLKKRNQELLSESIYYLSDLRHCYHSNTGIEEALEDAITDNTPDSIKLHGLHIRKIIESDDMEDGVKDYIENIPNNFIKELLALCVSVAQFGDYKLEGQSLFLTSIRNLKISINNALSQEKEKKHVFQGISLVIAAAILPLPLIQWWAPKNFPTTSWFYMESPGIIVAIACLVITIGCYLYNNQLQDVYHIRDNDHIFLQRISEIPWIYRLLRKMEYLQAGKKSEIEEIINQTGDTITVRTFFLKQILYGLCGFMLCNVVAIGAHINTRINCFDTGVAFTNLSSIVTDEEQEAFLKQVVEITREAIKNDYTYEEIGNAYLNSDANNETYLQETAQKEVVERVKLYNNAYYKWYELLFSLGGALIGYVLPYRLLLRQKKLVLTLMMEEVMQYQSVIYMLSPIPQMTPELVLSWLEHFAIIFKKSITKCRDSIGASELEALEELEESESFEPFRRLVQNLIVCDKTGMKVAFDELGSDREYYIQERKQDDKIQLDNRSALSAGIAFIPTILVSVIYLFAPIMLDCFRMLSEQARIMQAS